MEGKDYKSKHGVNFSVPRKFVTKLKSKCKETFFPDDPFKEFQDENPRRRAGKVLQYFIPVFEWLPRYSLHKFKYDLLAGITITSLAIPQGISYARLAGLPPIIGLYSSFVPPFIYAVFGSSTNLAVGTVAACSLLIQENIGAIAKDPTLYLHLVYTATFFTGIFQLLLGCLRLGILVDFLSHSTISGFMSGTAVLICLQQLKGVFGLVHFTQKTDIISVVKAVFVHRDEMKWQSAVAGICFLIFLQLTTYVRYKKPKLFWVAAMAPMIVVLVGCIFAYLVHGPEHGIQTVGQLSKGLNPLSVKLLNFDTKYLPVVIKTALITGLVALAEGIAVGRSFAIMKNEQTDGNKEMIAFGLMNLIGSFTSCYLTTGPFSKTAVNFNSGCKTAMSNVVSGICMMLVLLFLAPLFSYTPLVALSAIIMSAMIGLIRYEEMYHLFKVDKFDFVVCMAAFLGVPFISMEAGLMMSVGISIMRALLYIARPQNCKLGKVPDMVIYRDIEQYPIASSVPGILILQLGSPIYFANCTYVRERIMRWMRDEDDVISSLILDLSGATSIDATGIEMLKEVQRMVEVNNIKMIIVNPRIEVMEKMILTDFIEKIGKESIFLRIEDAVASCRFTLNSNREEL